MTLEIQILTWGRHKNVYGEDYLSEEQNVDTFCAVHGNIKHAHRFDWHKQVFAL